MPHVPDDGVPWASRGACNNLYPCCSAGRSSEEQLLQEDNLERKIHRADEARQSLQTDSSTRGKLGAQTNAEDG